MVYYQNQSITNYNVTGVDNVLVYAATQVPALIPLMLFAIFMIILLGSYFGAKRYGQGDFVVSGVAASFITSMIALMMTLQDGLINIFVLTFCFTIFFVFALLLFFTKKTYS